MDSILYGWISTPGLSDNHWLGKLELSFKTLAIREFSERQLIKRKPINIRLGTHHYVCHFLSRGHMLVIFHEMLQVSLPITILVLGLKLFAIAWLIKVFVLELLADNV